MIFKRKQLQRGSTLLIGMIMLVVLTLLVVYAIRSGNTNLRIAGNMQVQAEASAAAQQAIEQAVTQMALPATDISTIGAQSTTIQIGSSSYTVAIPAMAPASNPSASKCLFVAPVLNSSLSTSNANDVPCFATPDEDKAVTSTGALTTRPSACSTQQWEIEATATDNNSGVRVTEVQGITVRVPSTTTCL